MTYCPLCGLHVGEEPTTKSELLSQQEMDRDKILNEIDSLTSHQKRKLFWELSGIILVLGIIATVTIDLIVNKKITWSLYNLVASLSLIANISFLTLFRNRAIWFGLGSFMVNSVLLLLLDLIHSGIGWSIHLGIPVIISLYAFIFIVVWLTRISYQKGFNILAIVIIAIALFLVSLEIFISLYLNHIVRMRWSIITGSCLIPVSALLFFVHYRLKAGIKLHRFFNI